MSDAAVALADAYYGISRREGDPRYLGYAQAALTPWWKDPDAPTAVLVTRATILQSNHEFLRALTDLDNGYRSANRTTRARSWCAQRSRPFRGTTRRPLADCNRLQGRTGDTYVLDLRREHRRRYRQSGRGRRPRSNIGSRHFPITAPDARAWIESLLGEIAQRNGGSEAEQHFRAALAADPRDLYTIGAYSDWLLEQGRASDVIPLVEQEQRVDGLLLRLALAQKALRMAEADTTVATLRARFDASRARGDTVHRREEARFQLMLNNDAEAALRLAQDNWNVQREPADLRILAEAAHATGDASALETVRQWLATTKLEYPAVAKLVSAEGTTQ